MAISIFTDPFIIEELSIQWNRKFVQGMPPIKKTTDVQELIREYRQKYPKFILEKFGEKEFANWIIHALYQAVHKYVKEEVRYEAEIEGNWLINAIEMTFQYNFRNFQKEWKKYGENHFMSTCTRWTMTYILEGAIRQIAESKECGGLKGFQTYLGLKIVEYILLSENNRFVLEEEEGRRRLREEEKALRELKKEAERAEKDAAKAKASIEKNETALAKAKTASQIKKLKEQIEQLKIALQQAEERRERAISMAQQTRCGYVYVISNIGSFGEGVYKIGMTRRIDPMMRVRELGDASVPFPFDVHAMIYTEDAPGLESHLHKVFDLYKLNTMNWRKEYFRVGLEDIRKEVGKCGIHCQWVETASAEQYRESEWMRSVGNMDAPELEKFIAENPDKFISRNVSYDSNPFEYLEED